jgi:hypothetical protein
MWRQAMSRRNTVGLVVSAALVLAYLQGSAVSQQNSLKDQLVGTWTLISFELVRPDGSKGYLFGTNPKGVNTFDANGHFTLIFMRPDLPKLASGDQTKVTPEEAQAISVGAISYFGTYTVNDTDKMLSLQVDGTTLVNLHGIGQKRIITSIDEDELKLRNPTAVGGGYIDLVLKRAR